jgi:hypothetical protein
MLTVRLSRWGAPWLERLGPSLVSAVRNHPLAADMDALVLIGAGDPLLVRPGDPRCKVMVPLVGNDRPDGLSRAQIEAMDAVVLLDPAELPGAAAGATSPLIVVVEPPAPRGSTLLRGCIGLDGLEAADSLRSMPALRAAVAGARRGAVDPPVSVADITDAIAEAVTASGGGQ